MPAALRLILYAVVEATVDPASSRAITTMILLRAELAGMDQLEESREKAQLATVDTVLARGVAEGVIRPGYDLRQACAHLVGPLVFAHLTGVLASDRRLADRTIDVFMAAYGTGAG
ncbi:MAG TPA: TetR/AcrR family transcriptional regulator C-terminal ligand-binding domain-containing protein [Mycobacteriales bacterium]|nr:TetR/AcrR family transcriptional regulator C-terminal ligand-binding domain-containing protein [Mycobacteriales bacterium]